MSLRKVFKNPWWVVVGATLGLIVGNGPIVLFTFGVFLKPIASQFAWNRETVALALTASQTVGAIATPFAGMAVDRWGIRRVTLAFIVVFSLAAAAVSLTPPYPAAFVLLYAVWGLAGSGQAPLPYAKAISVSFEKRRGLALGIAMAGVGLGAALVPQVARLLISSFGWRTAYVGLGLLTFVVAFPAVALFFHEPESPQEGPQPAATPNRGDHGTVAVTGMTAREAVFGTFQFWLIGIAVFLVAVAVNGTIAHIVPILTDRGISVVIATSVLSAAGLALIAGRIFSGYLLDRFPAQYVAAAFFFIPLMGILCLGSGSGGVVPLVGAAFLGMGIGAEIDLLAFLVGRYFGLRNFGQIYGYLMAVFIFGSGLGPWIMGVCFDLRHSYTLALIGFSAALAIASLLISRLGPYAYPAIRLNEKLESSSAAAIQ